MVDRHRRLIVLVILALAGGLSCNGSSYLDLEDSFFVTQADAFGVNEEGDQLGAALAVGDFNGDGFEDLAQGAPGEDEGAGAVDIFLGSEGGITTGTIVTHTQAGDAGEPGDLFGAAMTVGDFNFDGFEDLAIGAPGEVPGTDPRSGAVFIFPGGPGGISQGFMLTQADAHGVNNEGDEFGAAMATGDVDGDFFEDLIVGAPGDAPDGGPRSGSVYVFPGSHNGLIPGQGYVISQSDVSGETNEEGDRFGSAIETGQFNGFGGVDVGDGFADLAVGAPGELVNPESGAVYLFLGDPGGIGVDSDGDGVGGDGFFLLSTDAGMSLRDGDRFGAELGVGDSNNDGVEELAVGVPGREGNRGAVVVFVADPALGINEAFVLNQANSGFPSAAGDEFGAALAFGVLDQDGNEELVVGAPGRNGNAGSAYVYPGSKDGLMGAFEIFQSDAGGVDAPGDRFGAALSIEDFNDNNAADLAAGAPGDAPDGGPRSGAVFVFPGVPTSPPSTDQERAGGVNEEGDQFGAAQISGDFNGDGFADLAVGAPGEDGSAGAVHIFPGAATTRPGVTITTGFVITQRDAGDLRQPFDLFGAALGVGDFNGDGFDDLAVGAPGENLRTGAVFIFPGSVEGITTGSFITETHAGDLNRPDERFGTAVTAGDFNGDGFDDLAVGAPWEVWQWGAVFIFPGSRAGIRLGFPITQSEAGDLNVAGDHFGAALAAHDFDGDGLEDLAVGAPGNLGSGAVFIFPGTGGGIRTGLFIGQTHAGLEGDPADLFGAALAAGDFNRDAFGDLAVGTPGKNVNAGMAFVFRGSPAGIRLGSPITQGDGGDQDQWWERFGAALTAGDGNGDGFDDLFVGAPGGLPDLVTSSGVLFMFPGAAGGINQGFSVDQAGNGGANEAGDAYGSSLAIDDFDGDGIGDVAVGAPLEAPKGPAATNPRAGALYMIDDGEIEKLFEEFERQQGTNDPLPPPLF